ncbi:MAG: response regulator transcription factor [Planctomycetota bacterium]|jgi:FixJ family two-component response regulator
MKTKAKQYGVFFVDDEPGIRRVVAEELKALGCNVTCFASASNCLEQLPHQDCNLLITDVKMPGMDGLTLLSRAKRVAPWVSIMVITGYGDIPMAVKALKLGAIDFIEKPLDRDIFLHKVKSVLNQDDFADSFVGQVLTKTEKKILKLILDGKGNKEIAYKLGRALRTVELHRSHIMHKFGVDNLVDLVKKAAFMNLDNVK